SSTLSPCRAAGKAREPERRQCCRARARRASTPEEAGGVSRHLRPPHRRAVGTISSPCAGSHPFSTNGWLWSPSPYLSLGGDSGSSIRIFPLNFSPTGSLAFAFGTRDRHGHLQRLRSQTTQTPPALSSSWPMPGSPGRGNTSGLGQPGRFKRG